jgi:hypothetical protein
MRAESVALLASAGCSLILALLVLAASPGPRMDPAGPSMLRPRGALARTLFERIANDKAVDEFDKRKVCLHARIRSTAHAACFGFCGLLVDSSNSNCAVYTPV